MDGGVEVRRPLPVAFAAMPGRPLHGAGRQIDQPAVQAVGAGVLDFERVHAAGEVPGGEPLDRWRLDLAVEAAPGRPVGGGLGADQHGLCRFQGERQGGEAGVAQVKDLSTGVQEAVALDAIAARLS